MGEGVPKKQTKEKNQLICDNEGEKGGSKKSEIFADVICGSPLTLMTAAARPFVPHDLAIRTRAIEF